MMGHDGWDGGGWGWGAWVAMAFVMVVFWAAVITAVVTLARSSGHEHQHPPVGSGEGEALRILDQRFAKGEIDPDEYARRRDILRSR